PAWLSVAGRDCSDCIWARGTAAAVTSSAAARARVTTPAGTARCSHVVIAPVNWFDGAGFGMFVHWDHASQQGLELSWPLVGGVFALPRGQSVPVERYHASAATFDPRGWDPEALARTARAAGMRYGVLTAKHHSGYAMFH